MPNALDFYPLATNTFTFTQDGTFQTVDVSGLIGTDAKAVTLSCQLANSAGVRAGARAVGSTLGTVSVPNITEFSAVVSLSWDGSASNIECMDDNAGLSTWSVGGQINDGWVADPAETAGSWSALLWATNTVNAQGIDSGNIECVIMQLHINGTTAGLSFGAKAIGEFGYVPRNVLRIHNSFIVIPVDSNDQFGLFCGVLAKNQTISSEVVGYIKKGYGVHSNDVSSPAQTMTGPANTWTDFNFAETIPTTATRAIWQIYHDTSDTGLAWKTDGIRGKTNVAGGIRTNTEAVIVSHGVNFDDSNLDVQWFHQMEVTNTVEIFVPAHFDPSVLSKIIDPDVLTATLSIIDPTVSVQISNQASPALVSATLSALTATAEIHKSKTVSVSTALSTILANAVATEIHVSNTATASVALSSFQINSPATLISISSIATASVATSSLIVNEATALITLSNIATASIATSTLIVNEAATLVTVSSTATASIATSSLIVNQATASVPSNSTAIASIATSSFLVNEATALVTVNSLVSPSVAVSSVIANSATASIILNNTVAVSLSSVSMIVNDPTVFYTATYIVEPSLGTISFSVGAVTTEVHNSEIALPNASISTFIVADPQATVSNFNPVQPGLKGSLQSEIDKFITDKSQVKKETLLESKAEKIA